MPDVIQLTASDTIVLRNDDTAPHMILYAFLLPGQTHERTLMTPGSEVYRSGYGVHGASFLNFTTILRQRVGAVTGMLGGAGHQCTRLVESATTDRRDGQPSG